MCASYHCAPLLTKTPSTHRRNTFVDVYKSWFNTQIVMLCAQIMIYGAKLVILFTTIIM